MKNNPTILDVETTTFNHGNAFDNRNKLIMVGVRKDSKSYISYMGEYNKSVQEDILLSYPLVGFNIKFDLHWLRKTGFTLPLKVWDCQIAEFLLSNQEWKYPSLNEALKKYGFPLKLDVVKTEYWDRNIDTDAIPRFILDEYLNGDLVGTEHIYRKQVEQFNTTHKHLYPLFKLQCQDLLVLADMEYNGVFFNREKAKEKANEIHKEQTEIGKFLYSHFGNIPISLTSDAHLSTILYGGVILEEYRIPIGIYKTGQKIGQERYKVTYKTYALPRLIEPINGTETRIKIAQSELDFIKKGILKEPRTQWAVNEEILKKLKPKGEAKEILEAILKNNKLEKLRSTYLEGWDKLINEMHWDNNLLHSTLNQCMAITGRLSSSKPNGQNADKVTKSFCESRYE